MKMSTMVWFAHVFYMWSSKTKIKLTVLGGFFGIFYNGMKRQNANKVEFCK